MSVEFKPLLARLSSGEVLSPAEAEAFFAACLRGEATPAQVAAAITALKLRGETIDEIVACARAMRAAARRFDQPFDAIDTCGTGGDGAHTLNVSTAVAFVLAGLGVKTAKHGSRAVSSRSGSSEVLSALGVNVEASPEQSRRALEEANVCFLFAPSYHSAMRHVAPVRAELGYRTVFNLLGPLSNPAGARRQVLGVFDRRWVEPLTEALGALGATRAWVVHGGDGLDEITTTTETHAAEWKDGAVRAFTIRPEDAGVARASLDDLKGGDPSENAEALNALLDGAPGPYRDIVVLNAAAALVVADRAADLAEGAAMARAALDDGRARTALARLIAVTNEPVPIETAPDETAS